MENRLNVYYEDKPCYDIVFEYSYDKLKEEIIKFNIKDKKICIVTENNIAPLYLKDIESIMKPLCQNVVSFIFNAGEKNKNLSTVSDLYEFLIKEHFNRSDMLFALGGGVVGDLTGFTASTYLRGIDFIQLPTTLLSQVDSSIGGKTGVDFLAYKNMVGAFYMPKLVYTNISTLKTLDENQLRSGLGEVIKHGLIRDRDYYDKIKENKEKIKQRDLSLLKDIIYRSCEIKKSVVENDPKEKGERAILNFGHTLGHAIEKNMNFSLLHGECVGIGCILGSYISYQKGYLTQSEFEDIKELFDYFEFPKLPKLDYSEVIKTTKLDKKMDSDTVKFILLNDIGNAIIEKTVTENEMLESMRYLGDF